MSGGPIRGARYVQGELPYTIVSAGSPSGGILTSLKGIGHLARGLGQSLTALRRARPAAAAAFGGYASVPAAVAVPMHCEHVGGVVVPPIRGAMKSA